MGAARPSRKLAVILHADVVGSTALVQINETVAHERIQDTFRRFSETINSYGGIAREIRGDALVAEFSKASDAVSASLAFQVTNTIHNEKLEGDICPAVRVGIAMGEVVIADNTITGDGAVLGQRLEQLAEPGAVCIQGAAYETVPKRLPFRYESLGEQKLKGFAEPVRAYVVALEPGESVPAPEDGAEKAATAVRATRRPRVLGGVIALLILVVGGLAWWQPYKPEFEPASVERMKFELPEQPSIAVLPFDNLSDDPKQEYFVDGMTEDLITDLSKLSGLFVIARNSVFTYKNKAVKIRQIAEDLGVRYVLEGSVRRAGEQLRINAQLIDATTGGHVWAERYDGARSDIFAIQDSVTGKIVAALSVNLTGKEVVRHGGQETGNADAYDAFLEGWARYRLGAPDDLANAVPHFEDALRLDSNYLRAHAALAAVYWEVWNNGWAKSLNTSSFRIRKRLAMHLQLSTETPTPVPLSHSVMSRLLGSQGQYEESVTEAERAVALDVNDPTGHAALASALVLVGRPFEGAAAIRIAMRLDPHYSANYLITLGQAQFGMERFKDAVTTLERAVKRVPQNEYAWLYLAATYGHLGRTDDNQSAIHSFNDVRVAAGASVLTESYLDYWGLGQKENRERLLSGLLDVTAGWESLVRRSPNGFEVAGAPIVDAASAKDMQERGVLFVDMRRKKDWVQGHIPDAIPLIPTAFSRRSFGEFAHRKQEVVFYCYEKTCNRSPRAAAKAITWGYQNVFHFPGGMEAWLAAEYPVETGK